MVTQEGIQHFTDTMQNHGINIEPAGIWLFNEVTNKKESIDANRKRNSKWEDYPEDNMGRVFLEETHNILVVDIDGCNIEHDNTITQGDSNINSHATITSSIYIPELDLHLPPTLTTQTSRAGGYHLYYSLPNNTWEEVGNRIIGVQDSKVDFLTYGFVFDLHEYANNASCNSLDIIQAPQHLIDLAIKVTQESRVSTSTTSLHLSSNITLANVVDSFLQDKITTVKGWNTFFRLVYPAEFIKKGSKKLQFDSFQFSYDLINKLAVKLTTTKELGTQEHTIPALHKIISNYGMDPTSHKTHQILGKQILSSLPVHPAELPYYFMDDQLTLPQHIEAQPDTPTPVFRVILDTQVKFIQIDRHSLEPILHNGQAFLTQKAAEALNRERIIVNSEGKQVGWDDNVPIIYVSNDPYEPQIYTDEENSRNIINLYRRTRYLKEATPKPILPQDNLLVKVIQSSISPDYHNLIYLYHAQVIFGDTPPATILWFSSLKSDKGGTGKSIITIDIISRVLGSAGTVIKPEDMQGAWGDTFVGSKALSLEDLPNMGTREFNKLYAAIKGATSTALRKLNMKGSSFQVDSIETAITGSSNERINLHPSDRRFICLEPAHLRGETEPLTREDAFYVEEWRRDAKNHSADLQDYVDYLLHIYNDFSQYRHMKPPPDSYITLHRSLFIEAPETKYRAKWVLSGQNNSESIITNLTNALTLMDSIRIDNTNRVTIVELFQLVVDTYNEGVGKTALPWNWFAELLPYIQSDKYIGAHYSKSQIQSMLNVEFSANVGAAYYSKWSRKWKQAGHIFSITQEEVKLYDEAIKQMEVVDA